MAGAERGDRVERDGEFSVMKPANLWAQAITDYWRDPRNIIGPPGALIRRIMKALWLALSVYVLFYVAGPSQVASWQLWMEDDELARDIAWAFTFAAALCFALVSYAAEGAPPIRVPVFLPTFESWRGWRTAHLHLPNVRVFLGSLLAFALFFMALIGQWNYYLHDGLSTGGSSVAAIEGSNNRVEEAEAALAEHAAATASALALVDQAIAETSAGSPTGRSRLVAQRTQLMTDAAAETTRLRAELRAAREATVEVRSTSTDPRPVDGQVAAAVGLDRSLVASLLDLLRSGVVEALLVMGAGLGLSGSVSRVGVPKDEPSFASAPPPEPEIVAEAPPAPEAPPEPAPRRRFVLPEATAEDLALALAIGPLAASPAASDEPAPAEGPETPEAAPEASNDDEEATTISEPETEVDPLVAAALRNEAA